MSTRAIEIIAMKATTELIHPKSFHSFLLKKLFYSHNVLKYMENMCSPMLGHWAMGTYYLPAIFIHISTAICQTLWKALEI